jgi:hypothetical protein
MRVKPGALIIIRAPKRKSCHSVVIVASCGKSLGTHRFQRAGFIISDIGQCLR